MKDRKKRKKEIGGQRKTGKEEGRGERGRREGRKIAQNKQASGKD